MRQFVMFLGLALSCAVMASATTYVINPQGTGDFPTIQAAIDFAVDGDVIELTDGTFTGDGNRDMDYLGKAITIQSQSGDPEVCVIDCEGTETDPHGGFNFHSGEPAESVLMGITIENGWSVYPECGGAVRCEGSCSPSIRSCIFSSHWGSAVGCDIGCSPSFSDCLFADNQAPFGAAIYGDRCSLMITHCQFMGNTAQNGGAIFAYATDLEITDCTCTQNVAHSAAGMTFHDGCQVTVRDCLFEGNISSHSGAALTFWISGPNTVERCTFVGNTAMTEGAALWSEKVSDTYVKDCTFWGNASPDGAVLAGNYQFVIENSVVAFGTQGPGVASHYGYAELACCDIFGNVGGDWVGTIADQYGINGNICEDPLFCDPENGDFRLDEASPCAPFSAPNPECDLIGAWPVGCEGTAAARTSWGAIKGMFR